MREGGSQSGIIRRKKGEGRRVSRKERERTIKTWKRDESGKGWEIGREGIEEGWNSWERRKQGRERGWKRKLMSDGIMYED